MTDETRPPRGIENPDIVDLITTEGHSVVLVMLEERAWTHGREQLEQLNDKLDRYFTYVVDGHLVDQYPRYAGLPVTVRLDTVHPPSEDAMAMLGYASEVGRELGLDVVVRLVEPDEIQRPAWE